ncbi:PREDICTED: putative nuclear RNA export factor SDE5 [Lupinus angustifolius]|uniref:putative nuclear RNA export factor SDE5 n=1 Tax=Lupinus angustifolius TaxID=3871 RepID=UPI00092E9CF5|nr:PREDICTED: putative nuclear RNA export factor SDE5 [Lupinus angustifolius]
MLSMSDIEERDLKGLLETFASTISLEDIANAYCEADRNVHLAAEILCASKDEVKGATEIEPAEKSSVTLSSASGVPKSFERQRNSGAGKSKFQPASVGTVAGIVGKDYTRHKTLTKPYQEVKKPLKIDAKELPESVIWGEKPSMGTAAAKGPMSNDVVNFLFKMLGDGFELERNKILDVLGLCGYDVVKTMENLLDLSASTLEKCDDIRDLADENSGGQHSAINSKPSEELCKERIGLQKEILESLFDFPERPEETPQRRRPAREIPNRRYHISVAKLPEDQDTATIQQTTVVESQIIKEERDDDENNYNILRKAVREYWITMKEYYGSAVEAFSMGDYARADMLLTKGHFYNKKAREADEKSAQMVLQTNETDDRDGITLDLVDHEPRDALRLLKVHLTSLCGICTIKYLRAKVGTGAEDIKGARKRLIIKLLDKNSIKWTEEGNGGILRIQVDIVDPKSLSFAKNK